jgi:site-specific recombinase XerD
VTIPILPVLQVTLDAGPPGELAFVCGAHGKPLTKESFGNMFKAACVRAQVHGKSAHGLCKVGATRAANNGATVAQLEALFGWHGGGMAALYTRSADRARLGFLVRNDLATSIPSPDQKVRERTQKL